MTSGGGMFSAEEVAYLKTLPAVADATVKRILYTEEFKASCVQRYAQGGSPVGIFREAGLDPALIGYKRIECAIARWRKAMGVPARTTARDRTRAMYSAGSPTQRLSPGGRGSCDIRDLLISQQVRRIDELERQVEELTAQLEAAGVEPHAAQRRDTPGLRDA